MKLGVMLDGWSRAGGAERHTLALMNRARERGIEVLLATLESTAPAGIQTLAIRAPRRRPARDRRFAEKGYERLKAEGCRVVLAIRHALKADVYLPHGGLVLDARDAKNKSHAGERHRARRASGGAKERFFVEAEHAMLAGASGPTVIAVSPMVHARMVGVYPALKDRAICIVNGVDSDDLEPERHATTGRALRRDLGLDDDVLLCLFLAGNWTLKGAHTAILALGEARVKALDRSVHLLVAGRTPPRATQKLIRSLGFAHRVHALGAVDDPRPLYAAADVLLHPTWFDPCSLVCMEALSMGVPVITTPANGVRDVMGQRGGIVVEAPGDPPALGYAIAVLADDALRSATADDARYVVRRHRLTTALDGVLEACLSYPVVPGQSRDDS